MVSQTRREFLKLGLAAAASAAAASGIEIPLLGNQNSNLQNQLNSANTQVTNLKTKLNTVTGFVSLNINEQSLLEAIVETIIPSDSTGPGAKEAGVIYFIDRALPADRLFACRGNGEWHCDILPWSKSNLHRRWDQLHGQLWHHREPTCGFWYQPSVSG